MVDQAIPISVLRIIKTFLEYLHLLPFQMEQILIVAVQFPIYRELLFVILLVLADGGYCLVLHMYQFRAGLFIVFIFSARYRSRDGSADPRLLASLVGIYVTVEDIRLHLQKERPSCAPPEAIIL